MDISRYRVFLRPAMIVVPFIAGILFQMLSGFGWKTAYGVNVSMLCIRLSLMVVFYFVILKIDFRKLAPRKEHVKILFANILLGVIPFALLSLAGYRDLALAAFFVGITPTANAAPVVMDFLGGKVEFVLTGFVLTNIFVSLALTGLIPVVTGNITSSFAASVAEQIAVLLMIPVFCALATRWICAKLERKAPAIPGLASFSLWSFTLFVISAQSTLFFQTHPEMTLSTALAAALVSFLLCAINFTLGRLIGGKEYSRESSQTLGQKNTTLTIFLALSFGTPVSALGPVFYVLWHNLWNAFQMFRYDKSKTNTERN